MNIGVCINSHNNSDTQNFRLLWKSYWSNLHDFDVCRLNITYSGRAEPMFGWFISEWDIIQIYNRCQYGRSDRISSAVLSSSCSKKSVPPHLNANLKNPIASQSFIQGFRHLWQVVSRYFWGFITGQTGMSLSMPKWTIWLQAKLSHKFNN